MCAGSKATQEAITRVASKARGIPGRWTSLEGSLGGGQQGTADYSLHSGSERPPGRMEHAGGMGQ